MHGQHSNMENQGSSKNDWTWDFLAHGDEFPAHRVLEMPPTGGKLRQGFIIYDEVRAQKNESRAAVWRQSKARDRSYG